MIFSEIFLYVFRKICLAYILFTIFIQHIFMDASFGTEGADRTYHPSECVLTAPVSEQKILNNDLWKA